MKTQFIPKNTRGLITLRPGVQYLTEWDEIPANVTLTGFGSVILQSPPRSYSPQRIEGRALVKPANLNFDPKILPIYRNGRWQGHKRARDIIGTFTGSSYYVDCILGDDGASGTSDFPLKSIKTALQKSNVAEVLVAPGWYDRDTGWSGAAVSTTADGVVVRPWLKRAGSVYSATSWTPDRNDWSRCASPNEHCFESTAGLADNVVSVIDTSIMEMHIVDGQIVYLPKGYTQVTTDTLCFATPHSFYVTTGRQVINPNAASVPEGMPAAYNQATVNALFSPTSSIKFLVDGANGLWNSDKHLMCEGLNFIGGDTPFKIEQSVAGRTKPVALSRCSATLGSHASNGQGIYVLGGQMSVFLEDCFAAMNKRDGLNGHKHASGGTPNITEINCTSVFNGSDSAGTNNASSWHDDIHGLRIGGLYGLGEGPSVADVGTGVSWLAGCRILSSARIGAASINCSSLYCSERHIETYDCSVEGSAANAIACTDGGGGIPGMMNLHNIGLNGPFQTSGGAFAPGAQK